MRYLLLAAWSAWTLLAASLQPLNEQTYPKMIAGLRGHVVIVNFWATWCEPCREEMPQLVALQKRLGFELVTVSVDEPEAEADALRVVGNRGFIKRASNDEEFINVVDRKWTGALPGVFLYDKRGQLVRSFIGEVSFPALETEVRKLL